MKRPLEMSRARAWAAGSAVLLAVLSGEVRHLSRGARLRHLEADREAEARLAADVSRLGAFGSASLEAAREREAKLEAACPTPESREAALGALGQDWERQPDREKGAALYTNLVLRGHDPESWPEVLKAIALLERTPGSGIADVDVETSGDSTRRRLEKVLIAVAFRTRSSGSSPGNK